MSIEDFYAQYHQTLGLEWCVKGSESQFSSPQSAIIAVSPDLDVSSLKGKNILLIVSVTHLTEGLRQYCQQASISLLSAVSSYEEISALIDEYVWGGAKSVAVPGSMVCVYGQGVLLRAESGIGKTDLVLELLDRGHHFIADDQVLVRQQGATLFGLPPEGFAGYGELYGIGVVDFKTLFPEQCMFEGLPLSLVLNLVDGETFLNGQYDHLRCVKREWGCLGTTVTEVTLPFSQVRNMALLTETVVRLNGKWRQGYDAASEFESLLAKRLGWNTA